MANPAEPTPPLDAPAASDVAAAPSPPWSDQAKIAVAWALGLAFLVLAYMVRGVLTTAAFAGFIAFLLAPLIRIAHQKLKIRRGLALVATYFVVLLGSLVFGVLLVGGIIESIRALDPVGSVIAAADWLKANAEELRNISIFGIDLELSELVDGIQDSLDTGELEESSGIKLTGAQMEAILGGALATLRATAGVVTAIVASTLVTLFVAIYLNADSRRYFEALQRLVPRGYEGDAALLSARIKRVWTGYLYGQLINSLITGFLVFLALWAVGLPGAFVMGLIMALLNMIPTFGPILAGIPGVLAALVNGSDRFNLSNLVFGLLVAGIYVLVVQMQANLIAPRVMGTSVRLPPAVIMLGLIAGFGVGGLLGALLAVPVIATLRDVFGYLYAKLTDRDPFPERTELKADPQPKEDDTAPMGSVRADDV